jgi:hypothetical protein
VSVIVDLVGLYESAGFKVRSNLSSHHFSGQLPQEIAFTYLYRPDGIVCQGGGIAFAEIAFFEAICERAQPRGIFVVGNAFGWSALALAMINPAARVVAIDSCPTEDEAHGLRITNMLAGFAGLDVRAIEGRSPDDVSAICAREFEGPVDLVFIDGDHTPAQQTLDFTACRRAAGADCIFVFHDVVNFGMVGGFLSIAETEPEMAGFILMRTPSGMGILYPRSRAAHLDPVVRAFSESERRMNALRAASAEARRAAGT